MDFIESAWRATLAPPDRRPIYEWGKQEVVLPHSARTSEFDIDTSPQLRLPFEVVADNRVRKVTIMSSTQSSKTTFLELLIAWLVANDPGPCMLNCQTDDDAKDMKETRLDGVFKQSPALARLMPSKKSKIRKDAIIFPHMPLFVQGANLNSLQGKSIRWLFNDEPWLYDAGLLVEAYERTTSYWNSRIVNTSQGGIEGDDLDKAFLEGSQHEWGFTCPECSLWQPFSWDSIKYDTIQDDRGNYLHDAIKPTVRYECAATEASGCNARFSDTVQNRRLLASLGSYAQQNLTAPSDIYSFHWNRLTIYWNEWARLVQQWCNANAAKGRGDIDPLRAFVQKVKGQSWKEAASDFEIPINRGDYPMSEDWKQEGMLNGTKLRVMTIDVQMSCFYVIIRSWSNGLDDKGHSRLRFVKIRAVSWEDLRDIQLEHGVPDSLTFADARHKPRDVFHHCAKYGWNALMGDDAKTFGHSRKNKKTGKIERIERYYSRRQRVFPGSGSCLVYHWSNLSIKDTLAALRDHQAKGVTWEVASDTPEEYFAQMDSEVRREDEKKPGVWRWMKTRDNHLWDCEAMQVTVAYMLKLLGIESLEGGLEEQSEED